MYRLNLEYTLKAFAILIGIVGITLFSSCEQRDFTKKVAITTDEVTEKRPTSAIVTGTIIDTGEKGLVAVYGHVWGKTPYPEIGVNDSTKRENARTTSSFSSVLKNLQAETKYYVRTYIIEGSDVVYGEQIEFTTTQKMPPFVSMVSVVKIAPTAAVLVGKIENLGEGSTYVTKYGHCWSSSVTEPTIQNCEGFSEFPQSSALQEFSTHLTYLNTETTYYVRAYASNEAGITYSTNATFVTKREAFGLLAQLIEVNGGTFNMGLESYFNTRPIHSVTVSDFALSKYEITNDVFATFINEYGTAFIKNGPYKGKSIYVETTDFGGMNYSLKNTNNTWTVVLTDFNTHPIVHVTWYGAYEFCRYYGGRMPTEAEWEYAATGADKSYNYNYSGSNTLDLAGWYGEYSLTPPYGKTHPVGGKQPNEIGTFDMTGNVAEWCSDWYADAYPTTPTTDPQGVITGEYKVVRGGAWSDPDEQLLVRLRKAQKADVHASDIGFRIVFDR